MTSNIPEGINEETLRDLVKKCNKCPKCNELCLEEFPVLTCNQNHKLCKPCFVKFLNHPCYQCKVNNIATSVGQPSSKLNVYCRFTPDGCNRVMSESLIKIHEAECKFRSIECFGKSTETFVCNWTGNQISILDHFAQMHKQNWCKMSYKHEAFIPTAVTKNLQLFKSHNKHFLYVYKHVKANKKAYVYIAYLGSQEEAKKYCYEMEFFIPDDPVSQLKFREVCLPDSVPTSDIISEEKCVVLPDKIRKRYTEQNKLFYRFWIKTTEVFGKIGGKRSD